LTVRDAARELEVSEAQEGRRMTGKRRKAAPLPPGCDALLSREQVAAALGVSYRTLSGMLSAGEFPPADLKLGALPRWRVGTFNAWVSARCRPRAVGTEATGDGGRVQAEV
jgi:predicted DNA-binding transcriptional regulator AlpA